MIIKHSLKSHITNFCKVYTISDSEKDLKSESTEFESVTDFSEFDKQDLDNVQTLNDDDSSFKIDSERESLKSLSDEVIDRLMSSDLFENILIKSQHEWIDKKVFLRSGSQSITQKKQSSNRSKQQNMSKGFAACSNQSSWMMSRIQEIWSCKKKDDSTEYFNSWSEKRIEETWKWKAESHTDHWWIKNHQSSNYCIRDWSDDECEEEEKEDDDDDDDDECDLEEMIELSRSLWSGSNNYTKWWTLWTDVEIKWLVKLFEQIEPQWQLIKQKDEWHSNRVKLTEWNNVHLKDQIQTVKMRYMW